MMVISKLDNKYLLARPTCVEEEVIVESGAHEWSRSEKAFICPRPRIADMVDMARIKGVDVEYDPDVYKMEKHAKIAFESTLAALRAMRQTGCRMEDIDYFRDHFQGKYPPYRHQLVTFMYINLLEQCAIYNEMGTGKTASVCWCIDDWIRKKKIFTCLIVAPNNILKNWEREIQLHTPRLKAVVLQGTREERLDMLDICADVYIINYEGLKVLGEDLRHRFQMVVLDEAHKIKDPGAAQTKICHDLFATVQYKVAMTGTPIGNNLIDLHQLMTWIDPFMFEPFFIFRAHWFYNIGFKWYPNPRNVTGQSTEKMMQEKVYTRAVRYLKKECLDIPPKTYITRTCVLDQVQAVAYKQMLKAFMTAMEEGFITAKNVLSQIIKLSEITSGFVRDSNGYDHVFKKCAKLDLLESLLDEIGPGKKVVIWARFTPDIKRIGAMLGERCVMLYGATAKGGKALEICDKFTNDPSIDYLVGNPAVGGLGLNMTAAGYAIYYSNDYSWIKRSQSEDRIHRMGSEKHENIVIFDLVCEKTIDEQVVSSLVGKKELARVIIDVYKAGIAESFGLLRDKTAAEEKLVKAAIGLAEVDALIDFSRPEYSTAFTLDEPECPSCHSKNVHPVTSEDGLNNHIECGDCKETWQ